MIREQAIQATLGTCAVTATVAFGAGLILYKWIKKFEGFYNILTTHPIVVRQLEPALTTASSAAVTAAAAGCWYRGWENETSC